LKLSRGEDGCGEEKGKSCLLGHAGWFVPEPALFSFMNALR
jgi:hypothetical protein